MNKNVKVYISLPITGCEDTVRQRYEEAVKNVKEMYNVYGRDIDIVSPVDIDVIDIDDINFDSTKDWAYWMGRDLETLLRCDTIYMSEGWENSKGCRVEKACAEASGLLVIKYNDWHAKV